MKFELTDVTKVNAFIFLLLSIHVLYFIVFFGLANINETYIRGLSTTVQVIVALILLIKFNPFREYLVLTAFDKRLIFSCASFLFINTVTTEIFSAVYLKTTIKSIGENIKNIILQ